MRKVHALVGGLSLAALASVAFTVAPGDVTNYSAMPVESSVVEAKLRGCELDLAKCIEIAQERTGGLAKSAVMITERVKPLVEVMTYGPEGAQKVVVDASSGEVKRTVTIPRFAGDPVEGDPITTASGLMYYEIRVGEGKSPAGPTSTVRVHYSGWLVDGTKFDSSVDRGDPYVTPLNQVIRAWTEGVGSMKVGGKRKLVVPPELGYGPRGFAPIIPPNAVLIFDVELIEVLGE